MKILAVDSRNSIGGWLIKLFTFSKWNHVAVMFEDTDRLDSNSVVDVTAAAGTRLMSYYNFKQVYPRHVVVDVAVPDEKAGYDFAVAQVGKKYDWSGIFGIIFQNRKWEDDDKWFCAELVEATCIAAGRRRFRSEISGVLPRESYAVY